MKEIYEAAEMELIAFCDADTISTSSYNDGEAGAGWEGPSEPTKPIEGTVDPALWDEYGTMWG